MHRRTPEKCKLIVCHTQVYMLNAMVGCLYPTIVWQFFHDADIRSPVH